VDAIAENLLFRVASGDPDATRACIDRYGNLVWGIARRFFGANADAEDAVQEAFLDLLAQRRTL